MKFHLKSVLILLCLFTIGRSFAQPAYSSSISVDIIPMNPQSGAYNYFGVSVTLDRTYDQNVTVSGYIYEAGSAPNTNSPFSITVTAGNTYNATSSTFFQAGPTSDASITLSTITPATVTSSGYYFSTQNLIIGMGPENSSNPYDYVGIHHNRALDYILSNAPSLSSASAVASAVSAYFSNMTSEGSAASSFFASTTTSSYVSAFASASNINTVFGNNGLSSEFCTFYASLMSAADYAEDYATVWYAIAYVEGQISSSSTLTSNEKLILFTCSSVLRYSLYYWGTDENIANWETYTGQTYTSVHPKRNNNSFFLQSNMNITAGAQFSSYGLIDESSSTSVNSEPINFLNGTSCIFQNKPVGNLTTARYMNMVNGKYTPLNASNYYFFKWSWKSLGKADGKGAIEGAVAGAIGGAWIAGPPGGFLGGVAGGIGWGAACSVSNAVGQLTGWW